MVGKEPVESTLIVDTLALAPPQVSRLPHSSERLVRTPRHRQLPPHQARALLDAEILAEVYVLKLMGGLQAALIWMPVAAGAGAFQCPGASRSSRGRSPLPLLITQSEIDAHAEFIGEMGEKAIWNRYIRKDETERRFHQPSFCIT